MSSFIGYQSEEIFPSDFETIADRFQNKNVGDEENQELSPSCQPFLFNNQEATTIMFDYTPENKAVYNNDDVFLPMEDITSLDIKEGSHNEGMDVQQLSPSCQPFLLNNQEATTRMFDYNNDDVFPWQQPLDISGMINEMLVIFETQKNQITELTEEVERLKIQIASHEEKSNHKRKDRSSDSTGQTKKKIKTQVEEYIKREGYIVALNDEFVDIKVKLMSKENDTFNHLATYKVTDKNFEKVNGNRIRKCSLSQLTKDEWESCSHKKKLFIKFKLENNKYTQPYFYTTSKLGDCYNIVLIASNTSNESPLVFKRMDLSNRNKNLVDEISAHADSTSTNSFLQTH